MRKVDEAEKANKEAENAQNLIEQEIERNNDLRAQIEEVEEELQSFNQKKKPRSCPPSPKSRSFSTSNQSIKTPQRDSKVSMRSSIATAQFSIYEYEELLGFIFAPPEVSPRLTPREEEIVAMVYNNTFNDFVKLRNQAEKRKSKSRKHPRRNNHNSNDDTNHFDNGSRLQFNDQYSNEEQNYNNDTLADEDYIPSEDLNQSRNFNQKHRTGIRFENNDQFTEENDHLMNSSNLYDGNQMEDDDQYNIYDQYDSDTQPVFDINSETDSVDELFLTLPKSFNDIFRNYLPRRIFKIVMWLKQLPKKFKKQDIPMKRKIITVLRVARHEASLLSARIAFLERRKFASSSPKRFNTEIHRYEVQLLILGNEMKRFRF